MAIQRTATSYTTLADHLESRREAILQAWQRAVDGDPSLTTGSSLPRTQLRDHIPHLLETFGRTLRALPAGRAAAPVGAAATEGAEHGLQRWQQGYRLREVTREWGHLHLCLADELDRYALSHPNLEPGVMIAVRQAWSGLCWQGVTDSAAEYYRLHQAEASGQARDLEQALAQLKELERRRAEALREAAHDLRGNVGVVQTTASILAHPGVSEPMRDHALGMLQKNIASLQEMLSDLMSLARLEAGHERREVRPFDAATLLAELCASAQPLAAERGLYLEAEGPQTLVVEGDAGKVKRVAQNLLLNALKYTERGGVTACWGTGGDGDGDRWFVCVRDTGPGFHVGPGAPLAGALKEATASAQEEQRAAEGNDLPISAGTQAPTPTPPDYRPVHQQAGEGVGLSIVKRLCELLDATLELESKAGVGSTFRVRLPLHYNAPPQHSLP